MIKFIALILIEHLLVPNVRLAPTTITYLTAPARPTKPFNLPDNSDETVEIGYEDLENLDLGVCGIDSYEDKKYGCIELQDDDNNMTNKKATKKIASNKMRTRTLTEEVLDSIDFRDLLYIVSSQSLDQENRNEKDTFSQQFGNKPGKDSYLEHSDESIANSKLGLRILKNVIDHKFRPTSKHKNKSTTQSKRKTIKSKAKTKTTKKQNSKSKSKILSIGRKNTAPTSKKKTKSTSPKLRHLLNIHDIMNIQNKDKKKTKKSNKSPKKGATPKIQRNGQAPKLNQISKTTARKKNNSNPKMCGTNVVPGEITQSTFVVWSTVRRLRSDFLRCNGKSGCKPFDLS